MPSDLGEHAMGRHRRHAEPRCSACVAEGRVVGADPLASRLAAKVGTDRPTRKAARPVGRAKAKPAVIEYNPETRKIEVAQPEPVVVDAEQVYETREAWMLAGVEALRPMFANLGVEIAPVRVSIGWPGGRGASKDALGQCWAPTNVKDRVPAIFVTPTQEDPTEVLETLAHEMIHAAGHWHHRAPFQKVALALGFENGGKTKTNPAESPTLYANLGKIAATLGTFPHSALSKTTAGGGAGGRTVQSTRMLKVTCETDGYTVRTTQKWLNVAIPSCPICGDEMQVEDR